MKTPNTQGSLLTPHEKFPSWSPILQVYEQKLFGKTLVFAMTIKPVPEFWRNQEIPEKFWKIYEQVKLDLFLNIYLFLIVFLIPDFCHPEPRPTTLQTYLTYYV